MLTAPRNILSLDVGDKRVGLAIASVEARLPRPLTTLQRGDNFFGELKKIIEMEAVGKLVVGLPRGLDGQSTNQTAVTEKFVDQLHGQVSLPVHLQDEALTSKQAEAELRSRRGGGHAKADIDALAAAYILQDFLDSYNKIGSSEA